MTPLKSKIDSDGHRVVKTYKDEVVGLILAMPWLSVLWFPHGNEIGAFSEQKGSGNVATEADDEFREK